jgi:hypothetical protein
VSRAELDQIAFKVVSSVMDVTCTSTALAAKKKKGETAPAGAREYCSTETDKGKSIRS